MFVIRPVTLNDLAVLEGFAHSVSLGMLSLPRDQNLLKQRIEHSLESFRTEIVRPEHELYLFILENTTTGEVGGCCGIYSKTGVAEPHYHFRLEVTHPFSKTLPVPSELHILHPLRQLNCPSELCALYLKREWRQEKLGELLSLSRLLFISQHRNRFDDSLVASLRGYVNSMNVSPFWESLGKCFLNMDFQDALLLLNKGESFIEDFLPRYPIYTKLLSNSAQSVIQKTHPSSSPALRMLSKEGLVFSNQVDIFDAGPIVHAPMDNIRTVTNNVLATVAKTTDEPINSRRYIVSNTKLDFRACYTKLKTTKNHQVIITDEVADALNIKPGDPIRYVTRHR